MFNYISAFLFHNFYLKKKKQKMKTEQPRKKRKLVLSKSYKKIINQISKHICI